MSNFRYRYNSFWNAWERYTSDGALVRLNRAWDGGIRVNVFRLMDSATGIYVKTHSHRFI